MILQHILLISPIWYNVFFYLFVGTLLLATGIGIAVSKVLSRKTAEMNLIQQQYLAKVDNIRKEHAEIVERLRQDLLKCEEDRTRQWMESEKETLHVLNGVSTILELGDKLTKSDTDKILKRLTEIEDALKKLVELQEEFKKTLKSNATN